MMQSTASSSRKALALFTIIFQWHSIHHFLTINSPLIWQSINSSIPEQVLGTGLLFCILHYLPLLSTFMICPVIEYLCHSYYRWLWATSVNRVYTHKHNHSIHPFLDLQSNLYWLTLISPILWHSIHPFLVFHFPLSIFISSSYQTFKTNQIRPPTSPS